MHQYKKLKIWQVAVDLSIEIYNVTRQFPKEETYGLTSQLRRASVSIPSNIAEGAGRNNKREFRQFLGIASGSCTELDTQLFIANAIKYLTDDDYKNLSDKIEEIQKMNYGLQKKLDLEIAQQKK